VWEEYRQAHPEGYRYSWFWERYQHWRRHLDVVLRQEHKTGEKMFVDWADGQTVQEAVPGEANAGAAVASAGTRVCISPNTSSRVAKERAPG